MPRSCPLVAFPASASCGRAARFYRDEAPGSCAWPLGAREGRGEPLGHDAWLESFWWRPRAHVARASPSHCDTSFVLATRARALGFWMPTLYAEPCDCDACGHRCEGIGWACRNQWCSRCRAKAGLSGGVYERSAILVRLPFRPIFVRLPRDARGLRFNVSYIMVWVANPVTCCSSLCNDNAFRVISGGIELL